MCVCGFLVSLKIPKEESPRISMVDRYTHTHKGSNQWRKMRFPFFISKIDFKLLFDSWRFSESFLKIKLNHHHHHYHSIYCPYNYYCFDSNVFSFILSKFLSNFRWWWFFIWIIDSGLLFKRTTTTNQNSLLLFLDCYQTSFQILHFGHRTKTNEWKKTINIELKYWEYVQKNFSLTSRILDCWKIVFLLYFRSFPSLVFQKKRCIIHLSLKWPEKYFHFPFPFIHSFSGFPSLFSYCSFFSSLQFNSMMYCHHHSLFEWNEMNDLDNNHMMVHYTHTVHSFSDFFISFLIIFLFILE